MSYDFIKPFEDSWEKIYEEYLNIKNNLIPWPTQKHIYNDDGWETYEIFDFPNGNEVKDNNCPFTTNLVKNTFPNGQGIVTFSRLKPNTTLIPHHGLRDGKKRAHMGLDIPEGDCRFQVEDTIYIWEPGKIFTFDPGALHSAWNLTNKERVILVLDFFE